MNNQQSKTSCKLQSKCLKTTEFRNACAIQLQKHAQYVKVYCTQIRVKAEIHGKCRKL